MSCANRSPPELVESVLQIYFPDLLPKLGKILLSLNYKPVNPFTSFVFLIHSSAFQFCFHLPLLLLTKTLKLCLQNSTKNIYLQDTFNIFKPLFCFAFSHRQPDKRYTFNGFLWPVYSRLLNFHHIFSVWLVSGDIKIISVSLF